jgi:hypothetical protein
MSVVTDRGGHLKIFVFCELCVGVAPLKDFLPNFKSAPAMLDLEQTLKELGSFVKRLTDDKEKNIQEILTRKKEICEEIHKIRKFLNDHYDIASIDTHTIAVSTGTCIRIVNIDTHELLHKILCLLLEPRVDWFWFSNQSVDFLSNRYNNKVYHHNVSFHSKHDCSEFCVICCVCQY